MILAVLGILGFGFWTAGSPMKARLYAQGNQRISDLANISRRVQMYYQNKGVLPQSLSDCDISPNTFITQKTDRVTGNTYLYRIIDATHFEIGAVFDLPTPVDGPKAAVGYIPGTGAGGPSFWDHGVGRKTFTVDASRVNLGRN